MRFLVCGDPHLKISTIETARRFLAWLEASIRAEKPELTILMGDLFDTHSIVRVEIMTLWIQFAQRLQLDGFKIVSLVGNHDQASPGSELNALICLKPYLRVIDCPTEFGNMGFIPYVHDLESFERAAGALQENDFLFVHQTFQGAQYENGFYDPNGFPTDSVKGFKWVISGHVHKLQRLGNILYVGSPYHANFNDAGEKKALFVMNTENPKLIDKILMSPLPVYEVIKTDQEEIVFNAFAHAKEDSHYKVVFRGTKAATQALADSADFKALKKKFKITFVPEINDEVNCEIRISEATSVAGMLDVYVGKMMRTDLDRDRLLSLSKQFLVQAGAEGAGVK